MNNLELFLNFLGPAFKTFTIIIDQNKNIILPNFLCVADKKCGSCLENQVKKSMVFYYQNYSVRKKLF